MWQNSKQENVTVLVDGTNPPYHRLHPPLITSTLFNLFQIHGDVHLFYYLKFKLMIQDCDPIYYFAIEYNSFQY